MFIYRLWVNITHPIVVMKLLKEAAYFDPYVESSTFDKYHHILEVFED